MNKEWQTLRESGITTHEIAHNFGVSKSEVTRETWYKVRQRDWKADPVMTEEEA